MKLIFKGFFYYLMITLFRTVQNLLYVLPQIAQITQMFFSLRDTVTCREDTQSL